MLQELYVSLATQAPIYLKIHVFKNVLLVTMETINKFVYQRVRIHNMATLFKAFAPKIVLLDIIQIIYYSFVRNVTHTVTTALLVQSVLASSVTKVIIYMEVHVILVLIVLKILTQTIKT